MAIFPYFILFLFFQFNLMFVIISHISCLSVSLPSGCRAIFMKHFILCICGAIIHFYLCGLSLYTPIQIDKIKQLMIEKKRLKEKQKFGERFFFCGFRLWGFVHPTDVGFVTIRECASMLCRVCAAGVLYRVSGI